MIRTYINLNNDNKPSVGSTPLYKGADYARKLCFYNYTNLDVYVIDRSNRATFIKGIGISNTGEAGFKVRVEREYSSDVAKEILVGLNNKANINLLTEDEAKDRDAIKEMLDFGRRVIKLDKTYDVNLGKINDQGFYYSEELDICIYRTDTLLPKVFPFNNSYIQQPIPAKEQVFLRGLIDIFIVDNSNFYSSLYMKIANGIISLPILRDARLEAGVYIRIEDPYDLNQDFNNVVYKQYQGFKYRFYDLDRLNELNIYNNRSEASMTDRISQERNIELVNKQHEIAKLKADMSESNLKDAKIIAALEMENLILKHDIEKLKSSSKIEEIKENHRVNNVRSKLEMLKLQYQINQEHRQEAISLEQARTIGHRESLKRKLEEEDFNRRMDLMDKDMKLKTMKLESDIINAEQASRENKYKDVQEACKAAGSMLSLLQTAGTLFKFLV